MSKRFLRFSMLFLFLNILGLSVELSAESSSFNGRDFPAQDQKFLQDKEALDLNKINSSVDAGSFYSIELSIAQLEENFTKMAQDLKHLKEQIEFAKQMEQKQLEQIRKLEQENAKLRQSWLDNSLDNSWTGSSSKLESTENKSSENPEKNINVNQCLSQGATSQEPTVTEQVQDKAVSGINSQTEPTQPMAVRQDVVVEVIENKAN